MTDTLQHFTALPDQMIPWVRVMMGLVVAYVVLSIVLIKLGKKPFHDPPVTDADGWPVDREWRERKQKHESRRRAEKE